MLCSFISHLLESPGGAKLFPSISATIRIMNSPTISVITATYNSAATLRDCLASVSLQSYSNIEHIIVDGASTDKTLQIASEYSNRISRLISEPDNGIYDALNKGIAVATGDIIGFLHSDDQLANDGVLEQITKAFDDPEVSGVYGDLLYVDEKNGVRIIRHWKSKPYSRRDLARGWMPPHPTLYVRRDWFTKIGGFDTSYRIAADYLSVLRLFSSPDFKATYIPEVLVKMRVGGVSNRSFKSITHKSKEDWRALRECGISPVQAAISLMLKNFSKLPQFVSKK